uniref:Uncharacterized protein n=2 Tax=Oryza TaxID=4527 RepID=A0A0E0QVL8_ORYRU
MALIQIIRNPPRCSTARRDHCDSAKHERTKTRTLSTAMMVRDAGGIANEPTWLSMAIPCSMNVEDICPLTAKKITKDAQVGNIRSRIFSSSTCVTVQSDHELMGLLHMALPNSCNNHLTEALEGAKSQVPKPVNS